MNKLPFIVALAALLLPGWVLADARQACTDLVLDYAYYRDRPDAAGVANVFTEDARMTVLGQTYEGRKAIHDRIVAGADGPIFRHMMSTIRIFPQDEANATGVSYVTVYHAPRGEGPRPVESFMGVGEYHDKFVRTEEGWRIAEREFVLVFTPPVE